MTAIEAARAVSGSCSLVMACAIICFLFVTCTSSTTAFQFQAATKSTNGGFVVGKRPALLWESSQEPQRRRRLRTIATTTIDSRWELAANGNGGMDAYDAAMAAAMNRPPQPTNTILPDSPPLVEEQSATTVSTTTREVLDGGVDAFTAQLAAMTNANNAEQPTNAMATERQSDASSPATSRDNTPISTTSISHRSHNICGLLLQRAIQTQLFYLADLRDEPTYMWLRGFLGHDHLDDKGRFNELDGLHCGWKDYLLQLQDAPPFTITVQLAPPKLNAQQKRNPFLAAKVQGKSYEESIEPSKLSLTLRTVARSLEREWLPVLSKIADNDRSRVRHYLDSEVPRMQTAVERDQWAWQTTQVVAGGEGDDQWTPLHTLNRRLVERFCTRVALRGVMEELAGVSLSVESGADASRYAAADKAAQQWFLKFTNEWVPKLKRGADDNERRSLGIAPKGHWKRLCKAGADADDVTEALWQELPQLFAEVSSDGESMRLYSPEALAARLRRVRADVCDELVRELQAAAANELIS